MFGLIALAFLAVPILEIYVILEVGAALGGLPTIGLLALTAVAGAALARRQGWAAARELQQAMATGKAVGESVLSAALVLVAAVAMLTPGFLTDLVGISLLVPPVRARVARSLAAGLRARAGRGVFVVESGAPRTDEDDDEPPPPGVIDV